MKTLVRVVSIALVGLVGVGVGHATATPATKISTVTKTETVTQSVTPTSCLEALKYADQILTSTQAVAKVAGDMLGAASHAVGGGGSQADLDAINAGNAVMTQQSSTIGSIVSNYETNSKACSHS